jgi:hypothetical protein
MVTTRITALLLIPLFAVAGCQSIDPYQREGAWLPNNANATNLRTMVAVPSHLVAAGPAGRSDGALAAAAVDRLRHDRVRALHATGIAHVTLTGAPAAAQPMAAGAGN